MSERRLDIGHEKRREDVDEFQSDVECLQIRLVSGGALIVFGRRVGVVNCGLLTVTVSQRLSNDCIW